MSESLKDKLASRISLAIVRSRVVLWKAVPVRDHFFNPGLRHVGLQRGGDEHVHEDAWLASAQREGIPQETL